MNRVLALVGVFICACNEPGPTGDCIGEFVTAPSSAIAIVGQPLTLTLTQPRFKCGLTSAEVKVTTMLIRADNTAFADAQTQVTPYNPLTGVTSASMTFTPDQSGPWQAIAIFEPSLGRVQLPVHVAAVAPTTARRFTLELPVTPRACVTQPWRTKAGLVLCERNGTVETLREGVAESFDGEGLVVLGNTVWSSHEQVLTRRVDTGSSLRIDAHGPILSAARLTAGFTSETTVIRAFDSLGNSFFAFEAIDGGLRRTEIDAPHATQAFSADGGLWLLSNEFGITQVCSVGAGCSSSITGEVVALNNGSLTVINNRTVEHVPRTSLTGFTPPESWRLQPSAPARQLVDRELITLLHDDADETSVLLRANELMWYGPGRCLGARGDFAVMHTGERSVTFVEIN